MYVYLLRVPFLVFWKLGHLNCFCLSPPLFYVCIDGYEWIIWHLGFPEKLVGTEGWKSGHLGPLLCTDFGFWCSELIPATVLGHAVLFLLICLCLFLQFMFRVSTMFSNASLLIIWPKNTDCLFWIAVDKDLLSLGFCRQSSGSPRR